MHQPNSKNPNLSKTVQEFIDKLSQKDTKPLYEMSPEEARNFLEDIQTANDIDIEADIQDKTIPTRDAGNVEVRVVRPQDCKETLPAIIYLHGGGWIMGSEQTHDTLIKKLAKQSKSAVFFVKFTLSPKAHYPIALDESYGVLEYIAEHPEEFNIDQTRIAIAGDSAGGNMAAVIARKTKKNGGPELKFQALFYPVTDLNMESSSYESFKNGPWLSKKAMEWFINAYAPDKKLRNNPNLSPIKSEIKDLKTLAPALIITAENDVLRDEGEYYAQKLTQAGVDVTSVRINGTIHDFMVLNALQNSSQTKSAFILACKILKKALHK